MSTTLVERELLVEDYDEPPLQKELTFGTSYRVYTVAQEKHPINPKHSPINVPFKLCRAMQGPRRRKKRKICRCKHVEHSSVANSGPQLSLLCRNILTQEQYMDLLSTPNQSYQQKKRPQRRVKSKICCKCELEPCSPRLIQMAMPNKRLVLDNWKRYQKTLAPERLTKFDEYLKSGNNLEPRDARYYFKKLRRQQRRKMRRRKRLCRKRKEAMRRGDILWLENEIEETVDAIVDYIKQEPLLMLNYQQMMTSEELLKYLSNQRVVKIRSRNTKSTYKKTVIEISDKLIKWMDSVSFFVDIQPLSSKELILEIPSLESLLGEEEEEEEEEGEEEGELSEEAARELAKLRAEEEGEEEEGEEWEEMEGEYDKEGLEHFIAKKLVDKTKIFGDEDQEASLFDLLQGLDEDILEKLIQILSVSPDDFLLEEIDPENLPGVTYGDILEKLKEIRDGNLLEMHRDKVLLEDRMVEWAKNNEPESVDDKILDKIHETATILGEWFKNVDLDEFRKKKGLLPGESGDETLRPVEDAFGKDQMGQLGDIPPTLDEAEEDEYKEALADAEGRGEFDREGEFGLAGEFGEEGAYGRGDEYREGGFDEFEEGLGALLFGEGDEGMLDEYGVMGDEMGRPGEGYGEYGAGEGEEYGEGEEFGEGGEFGEGEGLEGEGFIGGLGAEGEGEGEEGIGKLADQLERLDSLLGVIRGHKPPVVYEHEPGTICCLSLKIWAVWLLEITNNAHKWTKWIGDIIRQVRHYAAIIRGDVTGPDGKKKILYKEEWRKFVKDTEEKVIAWRQYSAHVKDLSNEIMENFHGKTVTCCPKCLQDHLIKNVVTAHETLQALTEAINCAGYWQRCLDRIVEQTSKITEIDVSDAADVTSLLSEESYTIEIEELPCMPTTVRSEDSYASSIYEIEELPPPKPQPSNYYELVELPPMKSKPALHDLEEIGGKSKPPPQQTKDQKEKQPKPKKSNMKKR